MSSCQVAVRASLVIGGRIIQAATQQTRPMPLTVQHRKRPAPPLSGTHSGRAAPTKRKRKRKQKQKKPSFPKSTDGKEAEAEGGPKSSPSQPSVPSVASSLASPTLLTPASTPSSETAEASGATTSRAVACGCCQLPRPERLTLANELSSLCVVSGWRQTAGTSCPVHPSVPLFSLPLIFLLRSCVLLPYHSQGARLLLQVVEMVPAAAFSDPTVPSGGRAAAPFIPALTATPSSSLL